MQYCCKCCPVLTTFQAFANKFTGFFQVKIPQAGRHGINHHTTRTYTAESPSNVIQTASPGSGRSRHSSGQSIGRPDSCSSNVQFCVDRRDSVSSTSSSTHTDQILLQASQLNIHRSKSESPSTHKSGSFTSAGSPARPDSGVIMTPASASSHDSNPWTHVESRKAKSKVSTSTNLKPSNAYSGQRDKPRHSQSFNKGNRGRNKW